MTKPYKRKKIGYMNFAENEYVAYFQEFLRALEIISEQLNVLTSKKTETQSHHRKPITLFIPR